MKQLTPFLLLLLSLNTVSGQDWRWLNPKPQANTLNAITFTDQNTGFAVGNSGAIIKTINGGTIWTNVESPPTAYNLLTVSFPGPLVGFAAGYYGTIVKTTDGGLTWTTLSTGCLLYTSDAADE